MRVRWALGLVAMLAATVVAAQAPKASSQELTDIGYSARSDNMVYVTAKTRGKAVHMVRTGVMGSGQWAIYAGPLNNRVRLILDDRKGLQEILALDTGQRITLTQVGTERIEYRLYAAERKFAIGSVLYRDGGRWLQGLMTTEEFKGTTSLKDVVDVTEKFSTRAALPSPALAWVRHQWHRLEVIPAAHAQNDAASVKRLLTLTQEFLGGPVAHEMMKGMLIGGAAFTAKLIQVSGGMPVLLQFVGGGAGMAALLPMLEIALAGLVAAEVARRTYEAGNSIVSRILGGRNLGDSVSALIGGLTRPSQFEQAAPAPVASAPGSAADFENLKRMADRADEEDRRALENEIKLADSCTRRGDFACAEGTLRDAGKYARNSNDRKLIAAARERMDLRVAQMKAEAGQARARTAEEETRQRNVALAAQQARQAQEERARFEAAQATTNASRPSPARSPAPVPANALSQGNRGGRAFVVMQSAGPNGTTASLKLTDKLLPADAFPSVCGTKFLSGGSGEDSTRTFKCDGTGDYFENNKRGTFKWWYRMSDEDNSKLMFKTIGEWGFGSAVFEVPQHVATKAAFVYMIYEGGGRDGQKLGAVLARLYDGTWFLSPVFFSRK